MIRDFLRIFPERQQEYADILSANPIWMARTKGVGVIPAEAAINYSLTGACLRGSGVNYDIRKAMPYLVYDRLDFEVPLGQHGDTYDRYLVRMEEMRQTINIIGQALDQCERMDTPLMAYESEYVIPPHKGAMTTAEDMQRHFIWVIKGFSPPVGEAYAAVEHPKGRARILRRLRRLGVAVPLPHPQSRLRQPQRLAVHGERLDARRRRRPHRHDRHRSRLGRPLTKGEVN